MVPEQYRELLQQIDLEGKEPAEVASKLGLTKNNLSVQCLLLQSLPMRERLLRLRVLIPVTL